MRTKPAAQLEYDLEICVSRMLTWAAKVRKIRAQLQRAKRRDARVAASSAASWPDEDPDPDDGIGAATIHRDRAIDLASLASVERDRRELDIAREKLLALAYRLGVEPIGTAREIGDRAIAAADLLVAVTR